MVLRACLTDRCPLLWLRLWRNKPRVESLLRWDIPLLRKVSPTLRRVVVVVRRRWHECVLPWLPCPSNPNTPRNKRRWLMQWQRWNALCAMCKTIVTRSCKVQKRNSTPSCARSRVATPRLRLAEIPSPILTRCPLVATFIPSMLKLRQQSRLGRRENSWRATPSRNIAAVTTTAFPEKSAIPSGVLSLSRRKVLLWRKPSTCSV